MSRCAQYANGDLQILQEFFGALDVQSGVPLPNSFEEAFLWHIEFGKSVAEAYVAAGYLGVGDVEMRAQELLRKTEVAGRRQEIQEATSVALRQWRPKFLRVN